MSDIEFDTVTALAEAGARINALVANERRLVDEQVRLRARIAELEQKINAVEVELKAQWSAIGICDSAQPGSYARGHRQGVIGTLQALRAAIEKATKK